MVQTFVELNVIFRERCFGDTKEKRDSSVLSKSSTLCQFQKFELQTSVTLQSCG